MNIIKTVSDTEFFENVSEEEKEHYAKHGVEPDSIEDMNIQCTACWKQVSFPGLNIGR